MSLTKNAERTGETQIKDQGFDLKQEIALHTAKRTPWNASQ
jgi:hypothetical protein